MFHTSGQLKASTNKLIVEVDPEISRYYFSLIPLYFQIKKQRYPAHISVIRNENLPYHLLEKYQDAIIEYRYDNLIHYDHTYFWLEVISPQLKEMRQKLGLSSTSELTRSPDGRHDFHITIGNLK